MKYLLTILPTLKKAAIREIKAIDASTAIREISPGFFIAESMREDLAKRMQKAVFTRHMHPIGGEIEISGRKEDIRNLLVAVNKIANIKGKQFIVQCRKSASTEYTCKDIEVFIGSSLEKQGGKALFDDRQVISMPELSVVSITVAGSRAYIGFSKMKDNLEPYADPARVYSRQEGTISRAEFKLREAITRFGIEIRKGEKALDLGAAPGGWCKVLQEYGADVTAIDPAELDARAKAAMHFRGRAEDFDTKEKFGILVNDMNIHPVESARITAGMKKFLEKDADVVFTAKLVSKGYPGLTEAARKTLEEAGFRVVAVKNLFHNREEVTFYCKAA